VLRVQDRILAFTFGYGRSLLRPDCYERDFGLRVALNSVNADSLRSIDMQTIEELTISTRRQMSRAADFGSFALDSSRDLLRGVTGVPKDPEFASRVTGSDALTIGVKLDIRELPRKCEAILLAHEGDSYKERFAFIDFMRVEKDPGIVETLDSHLVSDLTARNTTKMHLAPAAAEDWENISGFTYSPSPRATVYPDLCVEDALSELRAGKEITAQYVRNRTVGVRYRESETSLDKFSLYSCLVYETEYDGRVYVLSGGDWHRIQKDWAEGVRSRVEEIPESVVTLPSSSAGEREADYNARAAAENGWALMDARIISLAPPHDRVEMCDLLTPEKQLIHVKRKTVSATLSHLFAQGRISGDLLFRSTEFREKCQERARRENAEWAELVPESRSDAASYEIVYAILARSNPDWPRSLPFFSQLNLDNTASRLRQLGYRVSLKHVPADPE